ncbi:histidine kinase, partial [Streptomyces bambusae]|nr:histidine kinase [Streptomyces bambusae]
ADGHSRPGGLPRRIRQASLAPQLKKAQASAAGSAAAQPVADRDAEEVRTRMSALQRGWTAGRRHHAEQSEARSAGTTTGAAGEHDHEHENEQNENEGDGR